MSPQTLNEDDIQTVLDIVAREASIVLEATNQYLLGTRLGDAARRCGAENASELVRKAKLYPGGDQWRAIVDALTTNETYFLRDPAAWEALRRGPLSELLEERKPRRRFRAWSAACSTGQEACSLVMGLCDWFPFTATWDIEVHGTDVSSQAVETAQRGIYGSLALSRGLPSAWRGKYFHNVEDGGEIRRELKQRLRFQRANLAAHWGTLPKMDLILVRNVLIYFDEETRRKILDRMARQLEPGGLLMLSPQEQKHPTDGLFELVDRGSAVYRKVGR